MWSSVWVRRLLRFRRYLLPASLLFASFCMWISVPHRSGVPSTRVSRYQYRYTGGANHNQMSRRAVVKPVGFANHQRFVDAQAGKHKDGVMAGPPFVDQLHEPIVQHVEAGDLRRVAAPPSSSSSSSSSSTTTTTTAAATLHVVKEQEQADDIVRGGLPIRESAALAAPKTSPATNRSPTVNHSTANRQQQQQKVEHKTEQKSEHKTEQKSEPKTEQKTTDESRRSSELSSKPTVDAASISGIQDRSERLKMTRQLAIQRHAAFEVGPESNTLLMARRMGLPELAGGLWAASTVPDDSFDDDQQQVFRQVFEWMETVTGQCRHMQRFGGIVTHGGRIDGDKMACMDEYLQMSAPNADATGSNSGCLIYSIGVNNEWSFERSVAAHGCQVMSFDPSMPDQPEGRVEPGIEFYRLGIGRNPHVNALNWSVLALDDMLQRFGHENRTVAYLKADAEGGEMDMLMDQVELEPRANRSACLQHVQQMGLEMHFRLEPEKHVRFYREMRDTFAKLDSMGFRVVFSKANEFVPERFVFPGMDRPVSVLYEILVVKMDLQSNGAVS